MHMKKFFSLLSLFMLVALTPVWAQQFSINNTDAANYPKVVVNVSVDGEKEAVQGDFKILEKGKEVPFTFSKDAGTTGGGPKAICFLIETSGFTYGKPLENIKKAVISAIQSAGEQDLINVCYFSKANADGRSLNTVSAEFTSDKNTLVNEMKNKVTAVKDSNPVADVFKSIYDCLDFINEKQNLPANKMLIVISAAINNNRSPIKAEDCIDRANKFSIPVYTVTYKTNNRYAADNFVRISDKTEGKSQSAQSAEEITSALGDFTSRVDQTAVAPSNSYTLEFNGSQTGADNAFEVQYQGNKQTASYTIPEDKLSVWTKYTWWFIIGGALLVVFLVLVVWFLMKGTKKKTSAENDRLRAMEERNIQLQQQLSQQRDKTQMTPQEPQKFDLKRTQIGGGGGSPILMVSSGNFSKNFPLNKPEVSIGRNSNNDVVIPDSTVSGGHAKLVNEGGNWYIIDNGSTNGTFVNGTRINKQRISSNDVIKLGAAFLKIQF